MHIFTITLEKNLKWRRSIVKCKQRSIQTRNVSTGLAHATIWWLESHLMIKQNVNNVYSKVIAKVVNTVFSSEMCNPNRTKN